jgi:hypothetical protein
MWQLRIKDDNPSAARTVHSARKRVTRQTDGDPAGFCGRRHAREEPPLAEPEHAPEFALPVTMDQTSSATEPMSNLSTYRTSDNVWDRRGWNGSKESFAVTRLLVGVGGGALALQGLRLGTWKGRALAGVGGSLAWWAATGTGDLSEARRWFNEVLERAPWSREDRVFDESAASFPASDSPSWTPTVGTGLRRKAQR